LARSNPLKLRRVAPELFDATQQGAARRAANFVPIREHRADYDQRAARLAPPAGVRRQRLWPWRRGLEMQDRSARRFGHAAS
jgi:hypothetical protein